MLFLVSYPCSNNVKYFSFDNSKNKKYKKNTSVDNSVVASLSFRGGKFKILKYCNIPELAITSAVKTDIFEINS